jgi:hypothetical protein
MDRRATAEVKSLHCSPVKIQAARVSNWSQRLPREGISKQKLEETKAALRELGLSDDLSAI